MIEVKFKAFYKKDKKIYNVSLIDFSLKLISFVGSSKRYSFNEVILLQYTGLKDKNGIEIYERDKIKTTYNSYCKGLFDTAICKREKNIFVFKIRDKATFFKVPDNGEIIGNTLLED